MGQDFLDKQYEILDKEIGWGLIYAGEAAVPLVRVTNIAASLK